MIYIFQGCGALCKAPCTLCSACCKACGSVCKGCSEACDAACKGCSQACASCCRSISDLWAPIVQSPLGGYVIGTWATMVLVVAACGVTIPEVCQELQLFCLVDLGLALVHAVFAFYIQRRLVAAIGKTGKASMTSDEIATQAKELVKYDVGFCLYVFVFIGAFAYNCYGVSSLGCSKTGYQRAAVALMIIYGIGAWHFGFCWFCGQCCFAKAEKRGDAKTQAKSPPEAAPGEAPEQV